ncbi:3-hydroxyisobutyryl-CoA hydrolase [Panaeolus papilionaceus]|nr:3-hydroxyisobutyryl-CoA hydrolase [Panaeolus papilionaceus]
MLSAVFRNSMSRTAVRVASRRTNAIARQMSSQSSVQVEEPTVKFESNASLRTYILNRPSKLNALDEQMLSLLRPKIEEWSSSELCGTIVGRGVGRAFCAGGDVASVIKNASNPETRSQAFEYFKREFEMDYILASLKKPYVAILDGVTMGGGVGLAANARIRIATENTVFAMPETKIGYCPDVGASYFLSRMDGQIGTYLALTSDSLKGRAVFEHGFATHYLPSRRIPMLLDRLAELNDPHPNLLNRVVEEFSAEWDASEPPAPFTGIRRVALDHAFRHDNVESIFADLERFSAADDATVKDWAAKTLEMLRLRSPTSLKVALEAIRRGKQLTLLEALDMELKIGTAFCNGASSDFITGVEAVLVKKIKEKPEWSPASLEEVSPEIVNRFFDPKSPYLSAAPKLDIPADLQTGTSRNPMMYALPTEAEISALVTGSHASGGDMGMRVEELLARFDEMREGKIGVKEKVLEVVQRRCELTDNADGNYVWLKWKRGPGDR